MNEVEYEGEGLLARAFCHELDHLDGHMYTELLRVNFIMFPMMTMKNK